MSARSPPAAGAAPGPVPRAPPQPTATRTSAIALMQTFIHQPPGLCFAPMPFTAAFRCTAGCAGTHPIDEVIYRCPSCGDLLEVVHDYDALRGRSAAAWMKLFDDRYLRTMWPYGSGVWGKKEWVAPHVRDENVVSMYEGGTNLF